MQGSQFPNQVLSPCPLQWTCRAPNHWAIREVLDRRWVFGEASGERDVTSEGALWRLVQRPLWHTRR